VPVQPGGRPPAPGELVLLQAFLNSHYDLEGDHGAELLATPAAARQWLVSHQLLDRAAELDEPARGRLLALREALRDLARAADGPAVDAARVSLDAAARGTALELRFGAGEPRFVPAQVGALPGAVGALLGVAARSMLDGSWARLKVCSGRDCGWVFYDRSRNQTSRWCSMSVCGARAKARTYYQRAQRA